MISIYEINPKEWIDEGFDDDNLDKNKVSHKSYNQSWRKVKAIGHTQKIEVFPLIPDEQESPDQSNETQNDGKIKLYTPQRNKGDEEQGAI